MAGPSGPGSGSLDVLQRFLGRDGIQATGSSEGARQELSQRGNFPAPICGMRGLQSSCPIPKCFPKSCRIPLGSADPRVQQKGEGVHS